MSWLIDPTQRVLNAALDGLVARQTVVSANLANLDTPGYQPKAIDFESALRSEMTRGATDGATPSGLTGPVAGPSADAGLRMTDPRHLNASGTMGSQPLQAQPVAESLRNDGNTVDLESEMAALTDTQLRYQAVAQMTSGKLRMLNEAINGGR